jgi:hypothetical protein
MRTPTKIVVAVAALMLVAGPAVGRAYAVSIRDLVELSKEGVSDEILVALIETDGSRFVLSVADIRSLRAQGLSDGVIVAMLRTRPLTGPPRDGVADALPPPEPPAPKTIVIHEPAPPPVVVTQTVTQYVEAPRHREPPAAVYVPVYVPVPRVAPKPEKEPEPVYWGWGGKRRPDAWKEPVVIK